MIPNIQRRDFIRLSSALTAAAVVASQAYRGDTLGASVAHAVDTSPVRLEPAAADLYRVRMEISLAGNIDLPKDPLISKKRERRLPMKSTSVIDFEERLTRNDGGEAMAARRYYYTATSDATIGGTEKKTELRKDAKRVVARIGDGTAVLYGEKEYLTHSELELLQDPICSLAIDGLLPVKSVKAGDTWTIDNDKMVRILNLDGIVDATVVGEVVSVDAKDVKLQIKGHVDASVEGVSSGIDVAGKLTFDRGSQTITWLALAIRETREIGLAKPGFEVGATIKFMRQRLDTANAIRETEKIDLTKPAPPEKLLVSHVSEPGMFSTFLGRKWQTLNSSKGLTTLRMVDNEKAIAQCDIREMPSMKPGEQLTLEAFQSEIKKSLGDRFTEFFEAEEGLNGNTLRTMRVVATGLVQDMPVQWVFMHFSDDFGRRVAATFTLESSNVEIFAGSDAQLANSFQFLKPERPEQAAVPKSVLER